MQGEQLSEARERVLRVAEQIFIERGYTAVTMRDIAEALSIRQASLYHHIPGGKEQLFLEVLDRLMQRHKTQIEESLDRYGPDLRGQLLGVAQYLLDQPPINISRLFRSDLPALGSEKSAELAHDLAHALFKPLDHAMRAAYERGEIRMVNTFVAAVTFLAAIESLHEVHRYTSVPRAALAADLIDVTLDGLRRR
ncbi:MAG: hypothetical protein Fur005_41710 [Roseiflexaceae bacterium]